MTEKTIHIVEHEGFKLPIVKDTTVGRKGATGKTYYTVDFGELLATADVEVKDAAGKVTGTKKVEDRAKTGENILTWFRGFDSLMAFVSADFDKAMVSLQVTSPANAKTPKVLSDEEKLTALRGYIATIDEITRQRSGKASEVKRLTQEMTDYAKNPANMTDMAAFGKHLQELATKIASLQVEIEAEREAE